jgi:pyrimidine-specific ribonucleoside hydrolase
MHTGLRALALGFLLAACTPAETPSAEPASPSPAVAPASPSPAVAEPRPILVDTDLAGDDILALMALLREPAVEVRAITVDGNGEVHCRPGVINVREILRAFDLEGIPIGCGRDTPGAHGRLFPDEWRAGADAFYGVELPPAPATEPARPAADLIAETAAASSGSLTVVALGPWSNLADALAAHPELPAQLAGIHAMAGAIDVPGNVAIDDVTFEDGLEWNVAVDPDAFAAVLEADLPVTLVPLDATNDVPVPPDFAAILEADHAAAGADIAFEMFARAPSLTVETSFWDTLAAGALVDPGLVTWEDMAVIVDRSGRIQRATDGRPIRAAMSADREAFMASLLAALRRGAPRPEPFELTGQLDVTWDGAACQLAGGADLEAGAVRLAVTNRSDTPVTVFLVAVNAPATWADAKELVETVDLADPSFRPPDWIIGIETSATTEARGEAVAIASIPPGEVGAICATGEWPDLELFPGNAVHVPD